ncbi:preprotein translocase subunit SecE [Bacillus atrophaeus]|jgi:preprotein translocase subunit SecE|uniref:Protein translocase subunit SecE n=7 Tax=Bacillus subtilis group TaxID=653685 RepID=A0A0D7XK55_BACAM|nr:MULTISPECIES: preprotein translocase subunit SecE [Bacillus]AIU77799.1 preprotein translocase subunit SecE [Bacillus subtilis]AMR64391.1 preprotein translocase subunit SecE [Bacillus subtilis subsp. globigii]ARM26441.1 preprotein translocase subunit SecE [Bacillus vallismortis]MBL3611545.1 preprotein translocase subunit SecE [Bacillus sp. RHFS18]MBT2627276.1 preprotein translocase subunit SecE [Bacillus sp. ISL-32]COD66520.1 preprotein translocase subunit SecE [Streptococcus pneumoniae]SL
MRMMSFFKDVGKEMKKVSWPKGKELTRYTITVISTVIFFVIFFALLDTGISQLIRLIVE